MIIARDARPPWRGLQLLLVAGCVALLAAILTTIFGPAAVVAAIALPLALVVAVRAPGILLAGYLLVPFYKAAIQPYSPIDITIILAVANAGQVIPLLFERRGRPIPLAAVGLWLATGAVVLGGVLYAPDQGLAVDRLVSYWLLVLLPILPAAVRVGREDRYLRQLLWAFLAMGLIVAAIGLTQMSAGSRLVVLDMNTIQVARAAMFVPVLGISFLRAQGRGVWKVLAVLAIPAAVLVAVASGSRGPLLAMVAVVGAMLLIPILSSHRPSGKSLLVAAGLGVATVFVLAVALPSLPQFSVSRFTNLVEFLQGGASDETSAAARVQMFRAASDLWASSPILGQGTGGFETIAPRVLGLDTAAYPHNFILQIGADHGLVGVAITGTLIVAAFRRRGRVDPVSQAARALAAFLLLNAMVSGDFLADRATLAILLVVLIHDAPARNWSAVQPEAAPERSVGNDRRMASGSLGGVGGQA